MKLNAQQLRKIEEKGIEKTAQQIPRNPLYLILDNVYDTYNIGGIFRLADALCVERVYLCGEMETPPNARIQKSSIGTYKVVPWSYRSDAGAAIQEIRSAQDSVFVVAVEQGEGSQDYRNIEYTMPLALVLGNETYGILPDTIFQCDVLAEIPMWGINSSLNVIVSTAIVAYHAIGMLRYSSAETSAGISVGVGEGVGEGEGDISAG